MPILNLFIKFAKYDYPTTKTYGVIALNRFIVLPYIGLMDKQNPRYET